MTHLESYSVAFSQDLKLSVACEIHCGRPGFDFLIDLLLLIFPPWLLLMGGSEDFLLNKVGEGGSNILLFSHGIDWFDSIFWLKFVR